VKFIYKARGEFKMENLEETACSKKIETTIRGHKVTLHFADKPNPDVATQIKRVLLSTCLLATER